ncbi:MAG: SDR family NAD(P)-dependent oxidoreductase [Syntrophothermus sp.]
MAEKEKSVIWVTGASSGIGREAALEFIKAGFRVAASARRKPLLEQINLNLPSECIPADIYECDISSFKDVAGTVSRISESGEIDCLINNAGATVFKYAEDTSAEETDRIISTNLSGAIYAIKSVLPKMIERRQGTIINVLSVAAEQVLKGSSSYAASKAGLLAYTNVLREEVRKYNIKVINILPGATITPMWPVEITAEKGDVMMHPGEIARLMVSLYLQNNRLITEHIRVKPIVGDL